MAEHAVDNSSARYRSKRQAARTVSSGNVDMLSLKATEDRQSVNAHWPKPDPNLRERGTCQPGRNSQRFVQLLAYPAGRHPVSYTHLRAHETVLDLVCRLLLE